MGLNTKPRLVIQAKANALHRLTLTGYVKTATNAVAWNENTFIGRMKTNGP